MLGDSVRRRQPRRHATATETRTRRRSGGAGWKTWLIGVPLALVVPAAIGYLVAVFILFPPTEVSGAGVPVPDLVGESASDAQRALAFAGLGPLEASNIPHPSAPVGEVIAQSPLAGQQLRPGAGVLVAISSGPPRSPVPDVLGFQATRAESLLRRAGFDVTTVEQESMAAAGRVLRTEPQPGEERVLPSMVRLIVSAGPPQPVLLDTLAGSGPDTGAVFRPLLPGR
ncbi:MAG: PASTA domain-containing protein [Gemmatimonadota bacterium]